MRVLLVSGEYSPVVGGVGRFAQTMAGAITAAGGDVQVVTSAGGIASTPGVRRGPAAMNHAGIKLLPLTVLALSASRASRFDVLIAMTCAHEGVVCRTLSALRRIPFVVVAHGSELLDVPGRELQRSVGLSNLRRATAIVANSSFTKGLLTAAGVSTPIEVINPPAGSHLGSAREANERFGLAGRRVLLTAARLVPRKGHRHAIDAVASLVGEFPELAYVITGRGPLAASLEMRVRALGLERHVLFTGEIDDTTLGSLYQRAELYLAPNDHDTSDVEGFGMSLVEAAIVGVPAIAGLLGGLGDAAGGEGTVVEIPVGDADALIRETRRLLRDVPAAKALGARARARAEREFSVEVQGNKLMSLLTACSARPEKRGEARAVHF